MEHSALVRGLAYRTKVRIQLSRLVAQCCRNNQRQSGALRNNQRDVAIRLVCQMWRSACARLSNGGFDSTVEVGEAGARVERRQRAVNIVFSLLVARLHLVAFALGKVVVACRNLVVL